MATDAGPLYPGATPYVPADFNNTYGDRFWLNYILKFRLLETAPPHDISRYKFFQKMFLTFLEQKLRLITLMTRLKGSSRLSL